MEEEDMFFCGGEEEHRRKRRKIFEEGKCNCIGTVNKRMTRQGKIELLSQWTLKG